MDVEFKLGETKFHKLTYQQQLIVKQRGRPMPDLNLEVAGKSRGKLYKRQFNSETYSRNNWICGSSEKNALFCFPCALFWTDMGPKGEKLWRETGLKDLVHLNDKIKSHESTLGHINSEMQFALFGNGNPQLDWVNIQKHNEEVIKNRYILTKIIDCVKFCGAFELALNDTETSENPGIFHGLINFSAELDSTLKSRLETSSIFKGTSNLKTIQNDIIDCMLEVYHEEVLREINEAPFVAVMVDEARVVSEKFQLSIVCRYATNEGTPVERFYTFVLPEKQDAVTVSQTILNVLNPLLGNNKDKLIAQSYDSAVQLSGTYGGVQNLVKQKYINAHFVYYYAHHLSKIMTKACGTNSEVRLFFGELQQIYAFFFLSRQRLAILMSKLVGQFLSLSSTTRWNIISRMVNLVYENRAAVLECIEQLEEDSNLSTCKKAADIRRILEDANFTFWLTFFHFIMPHVDVLYEQLQKKNMDPIEAERLINNFEESINNVRYKIDAIIGEASKFITTNHQKNRTSENDHRVACMEVCDVIIINAEERFAFMNHLVAASLLDTEKFDAYNNKFPQEILDQTCDAYKFFDKEHLKTELMVLYSNTECKRIYGAVPFLKFIISNNLDATMTETKKLLQILVTTPMATTEADRCFTTLQRINTFLRNSNGEDRLTALTMLSIESKCIASISNFNEKVIEKLALGKEGRDDAFSRSLNKLNEDINILDPEVREVSWGLTSGSKSKNENS